MQNLRQPLAARENTPTQESNLATPFKHFDYASENENEQRTPSPEKQLRQDITPDSVQRNAQAVLDALNTMEVRCGTFALLCLPV